MPPSAVTPLSAASQAWLAAHARAELARAMGLAHAGPGPVPSDPALQQYVGVFVSWHGDAGALVGCIGTLEGRAPLAQAVAHFAVQAGLHDHRTPPVTADQLPALVLEITLLGRFVDLPARDTPSIVDALVPKRDGLAIEDDEGRRAFFLPVVWAQLPEPQAFVAALLRKAGIAAGTTPLYAQVCEGLRYEDPGPAN